MSNFLDLIILIFSATLILTILMQSSDSSPGLGMSSMDGANYRSRRGLESALFNSTIVQAIVLFAALLWKLIG
jgi:protein translocase SecG subunit